MTSLQKISLLRTREKIFDQIDIGELTVNQAVGLLGVTRQDIWYRRQQIKKHGPSAALPMKPGIKFYQRAWNRTTDEIEDKVVKLREETNAGPTTISSMLADEGIIVLKITVYRILIRKNIVIPKQKGKVVYQRYTLGYPGAEIQFDFTQIEDSAERFWIASAVDDHTRYGFAKVYDRCTAANAIDFLKHIIDTAPFPIFAVRTDQGSEVHKQFTKECNKYQIKHIKNRIKTPRHNGKVERFHRTIQEECLWYKWHWRLSKTEAEYRLKLFLGFYNDHRHHQGFGMNNMTPKQKLNSWIINNLENQTMGVKRSVIPYINLQKR